MKFKNELSKKAYSELNMLLERRVRPPLLNPEYRSVLGVTHYGGKVKGEPTKESFMDYENDDKLEPIDISSGDRHSMSVYDLRNLLNTLHDNHGSEYLCETYVELYCPDYDCVDADSDEDRSSIHFVRKTFSDTKYRNALRRYHEVLSLYKRDLLEHTKAEEMNDSLDLDADYLIRKLSSEKSVDTFDIVCLATWYFGKVYQMERGARLVLYICGER